jgi:iron(III) transport system ATP-binding protein
MPTSAATDAPRLEVTNLNRSFGGRKVVDDVSLSVAAGQVTCLLGPSGCGKSTTLRMIAGVEMQDSGKIMVDGELVCDTVTRVPAEARSIGLMFQDFALFPHLTVAGNIAFGLRGSRAQKAERVNHLLKRIGLPHYADAYPHQLSGGEQQRIALARALAPQPKIMLMDEPFSGLDNRLRDDIRDETLEVLKEEGTAVLLVTHEPDEAMRMADEIALMRDGVIVQRGAPYNVHMRPVDKDAAAFFSDLNIVHGARSWRIGRDGLWPVSRPLQCLRVVRSRLLSAHSTLKLISTGKVQGRTRRPKPASLRAAWLSGHDLWARIHSLNSGWILMAQS